MKTRNLHISVSIDPPVSGYGGFDCWDIDDVPNDENFQDALHNFILAWSQARKLDAGWTGVE